MTQLIRLNIWGTGLERVGIALGIIMYAILIVCVLSILALAIVVGIPASYFFHAMGFPAALLTIGLLADFKVGPSKLKKLLRRTD